MYYEWDWAARSGRSSGPTSSTRTCLRPTTITRGTCFSLDRLDRGDRGTRARPRPRSAHTEEHRVSERALHHSRALRRCDHRSEAGARTEPARGAAWEALAVHIQLDGQARRGYSRRAERRPRTRRRGRSLWVSPTPWLAGWTRPAACWKRSRNVHRRCTTCGRALWCNVSRRRRRVLHVDRRRAAPRLRPVGSRRAGDDPPQGLSAATRNCSPA